jgi:hypothetical protein
VIIRGPKAKDRRQTSARIRSGKSFASKDRKREQGLGLCGL